MSSIATLFQYPRDVMEHAQIPLLGRAILTVLVGWEVAKAKRRFLVSYIKHSHKSKTGRRLGRFTFYDGFLNVIIAYVVASFLISMFHINFGPGINSMFAAGGLGALIFGIASKDLAEQVVGGLVLATWDVFEEGEDVHLHQMGIEGTVMRIGLADTEIQLYDNMIVKIPNGKIFNQNISNYSRIKFSQVKQTLRFKYSDLHKLGDLLPAILDKIRATCPEVITDGSRCFRCHFYGYEQDHVTVVLNVHLEVAPGTTAYMDSRQRVNQAIAKAVEEHGIEFAIPAVRYLNFGEKGNI